MTNKNYINLNCQLEVCRRKGAKHYETEVNYFYLIFKDKYINATQNYSKIFN